MAAKSQAQSVSDERDLEAVAGPALSRYLFQAEEAERRRLARELHDETSQELTLVRFQLGILQRSSDEKSQKTIEDTFKVLDRTIEGLRRIVGRLSPQALEKLGLIGSIRKEARSLMDQGVQVNLRVSANFERMSAEAELALYRLVQEALHNVAKHANARNVEVDLSRKNGKVILVIQDDGVGLGKKVGVQHRSFGIFGMRERVRCLNGTFRIRSRQGRGTRIEVFLDQSVCMVRNEASNQFRLIDGKAPRSGIALK